jgi:cytochrome c553
MVARRARGAEWSLAQMKKWFAVIGLLPFMAAPAAGAATGDPEAGAQKAAVCGACHGVDGNSLNPEWPKLAAQQASYIEAQLAAFKQGQRVNVVMAPNAMILGDQDMADLAAYFSRQALQGLEADPSLYEAGQKLYRGGDASRGLPACIACHGPQGEGNGPAQYPSLRAQHSVYTYNQLKAYASGERKAVTNSIMQAVASKLSDEEMRAVASYLQGLR